MAHTEEDLGYLRGVLETQSSNRANGPHQAIFERRLIRFAERSFPAGVAGLVQTLRAEPKAFLHAVVAEAMTIKETSFFRDVTPFRLLSDGLIPRLIKQNKESRRLAFWSAASSTGQEAYSLAMLLLDGFPELANWDVTIVGTDISQQACDYARRGRYGRLEINRGLPARFLLKYFERDGEDWVAKPELRRMVTFQRMNLCALPQSFATFDVVLLRNVLLYFAAEERLQVLEGVHRRMSPDGALLLGASEQAEDSCELFSVKFDGGCYYYQPVVVP
jgi:chemotaxis protein methyltransferase CheR